MFIRSQDKTDLIDISGKRIFVWNDNQDNFCVYVDLSYGEESTINMGFYESKERAVEVLDEIQNQLINQNGGSYSTILDTQKQTSYGVNVYQMPTK
jgi:hypothetical protein